MSRDEGSHGPIIESDGIATYPRCPGGPDIHRRIHGAPLMPLNEERRDGRVARPEGRR